MSDCCLTSTQKFSAISWREQVNFQSNDDEVHFVLDDDWLILIFAFVLDQHA